MNEIYAYLAKNDKDEEDVVFVLDQKGRITPLVCKTREEADHLSPIAEAFRVATGIKPKLYRFTNREEVL